MTAVIVMAVIVHAVSSSLLLLLLQLLWMLRRSMIAAGVHDGRQARGGRGGMTVTVIHGRRATVTGVTVLMHHLILLRGGGHGVMGMISPPSRCDRRPGGRRSI